MGVASCRYIKKDQYKLKQDALQTGYLSQPLTQREILLITLLECAQLTSLQFVLESFLKNGLLPCIPRQELLGPIWLSSGGQHSWLLRNSLSRNMISMLELVSLPCWPSL